ncbi:MAG: relaxase/mobilization nuclease domain-containing protein [Beijerinckiaceae bacterium]
MSGNSKLGKILSRLATSIRPDQACEAGLTPAAEGVYKTRQKSSHDRQPTSGPRAGAKLTVAEGARFSDLQIMGAAELAHRDQRRPGGKGGGAASVRIIQLPLGLSPGVASKVAYAKGAQPAFFKIISGARGGARVSALFEYLGTRSDPDNPRERHDIEILAQDGRVAASKGERDAIIEEWSATFTKTRPEKDVYRYSVVFDGGKPLGPGEAKQFLDGALGGRAYAFAISGDGEGTQTLTVAVATGASEKRGKAADVLLEKLEDDIWRAAQKSGHKIHSTYRGGSGYAFAGIKHQLDRLAAGDFGTAYSSDGQELSSKGTRQIAAQWAKAIGRARTNDVTHTVFSARAGTAPKAFAKAVAETLDEEFAGFKFVVASHADKKHVHVHAVIQNRNGAGEKLRVSKADLERVRSTLARNARENGIDMVHMTRDDTGSAPGYSKEDAAAVRKGQARPATEAAVKAKQANDFAPAATEKAAARQAQAAREWQAAAENLKSDSSPEAAKAYVRAQKIVADLQTSSYKSTSNTKLTLFEQSDLIFAKAIEDSMSMTTAADLRETTNQAIQKIEALADLATDEDAAKLRQQGQQLHKLAAAREILIDAELRENTARASVVTSARENSDSARPAERTLSREAEALREAAIETARVASENDPTQGASSPDATDGQIHKIAEAERAAALRALEQAERDGASKDRIAELQASLGRAATKSDPDRDDEREV